MVKINFDRAVFSGENKSGIGVVIRDSSGSVITSCSKKIAYAFSSCEVEALAAATALSFVAKIAINKAVLEGDSLVVIKALIKPKSPLSSIGPWIEDSKIFSNNFSQLLYSHTRRECNKVAHSLARYAINIPDFLVWMEDIPLHFIVILHADLANLNECISSFHPEKKKKKKCTTICIKHLSH